MILWHIIIHDHYHISLSQDCIQNHINLCHSFKTNTQTALSLCEVS
jgi:hypothetical protein